MKTNVYNKNAEQVSTIDLPENIFGLEFNNDLVHQVMVSMNSNKRINIAHTKDRSDVRGGGKKPWAQKGTGRARHGSNRSPIWIGGGVTFGPRNDRNFSKKINKKQKTAALFNILSQKMKDNEIIFLDNFDFSEPKTVQSLELMKKISTIEGFENILTKKKNSALFTTIDSDINVRKSFSNISNTNVLEFRKLNILDLLKYKYLVVSEPKESLELLLAKIK